MIPCAFDDIFRNAFFVGHKVKVAAIAAAIFQKNHGLNAPTIHISEGRICPGDGARSIKELESGGRGAIAMD
jgi:hypothetical protein